MARHTPDGPDISYEEVDTSLIPPRPRTYGLKGAEIIEEVWRQRAQSPERKGDAVTAAAGSTKT
jgi:succinate dehydrogenase / fumarate reductase flavoprotein subunit